MNERIKSVLEHDQNELISKIEEYKKIDSQNQDALLEKNIADFYGKENVKWMSIYHKASGIAVEMGDDLYYEDKEFNITHELNFNLTIKYQDRIVFKCTNGRASIFIDENDWIDKINSLYKRI